ncbi:MAG: hypothetical protein K9G67_15005 [Bacteroidales bacterium]|nr:hypothetical protein [Bacteroidales bacterium]MCF8344418.1 hypothetical protein [Bacteroidales bacterium]MCF8351209.1 hypothetical protein [Bacteroidales bacterium]MCF8377662.1 hypothetical protein [Bacteroidales bacterium]MCF8402062.1 hypothetical protein [Bacteroidales bacterium]
MSYYAKNLSGEQLKKVYEAASGQDVIVCKDSFKAGRMRKIDFEKLCSDMRIKRFSVRLNKDLIYREIMKT